jgi:cysteine desulfurase
MRELYFDNAASSPLDPRVFEEMRPWLMEDFGNAHSLHHWGRKAMMAVERARIQLAELLDAEDPSEIVFTSGATEANCWVMNEFETIALSPFEHSSVREPALAKGAFEIGADGWKLLAPEDEYDLMSVMLSTTKRGA